MQILEWPHEALRTKCEEIVTIDERTWLLLDEMWETMEAVKDVDAMALAANQVGAMIRLFIMRDSSGVKHEMLNPEWKPIKAGGWASEDEGCLSTPGLFEQVYGRHNRIWVQALNRNGQKATMQAEGIDAVCIQHEVDHLDGIFWWERMKRTQRRRMISAWKKKGGKHVVESVSAI